MTNQAECTHEWHDKTHEFNIAHEIIYNGLQTPYSWRQCVKCKAVEYIITDMRSYAYGGNRTEKWLCEVVRGHDFEPISVHIESCHSAMNMRLTGYLWGRCNRCGVYLRTVPPRTAIKWTRVK